MERRSRSGMARVLIEEALAGRKRRAAPRLPVIVEAGSGPGGPLLPVEAGRPVPAPVTETKPAARAATSAASVQHFYRAGENGRCAVKVDGQLCNARRLDGAHA